MMVADRVKVAVVGLGKMGISHLAIANASETLEVVAVCDTFAMLGRMVEKHCRLAFIPNYHDVLATPGLDAVILASPTRFHADMVRAALAKGLHVFCEKPLTLSPGVSRELAGEALRRALVGQVGYHNRFVGTFAEAKRLLDQGAIGTVRHLHGEAYGPVVLKPSGRTWRSQPAEGGGCLYDYAAHPTNLMNWYAGRTTLCSGAELVTRFSADVEDAVYANLRFASGATGQLSVNWSDETVRKMSTRVSIWGDGGKLIVDRQELKVYIGSAGEPQPKYGRGWTSRYITELTPPVSYYLRGEEYTAQLEAFALGVVAGRPDVLNDFGSAAETDHTLELIRARAASPPKEYEAAELVPAQARTRNVFARVLAG